MENYIAKMKKPNHNIYDLNSLVYKIAVLLCIAIWILLFFDVPIRQLSISNQIYIWGVTVTVAFFIAFISEKNKKCVIIPYSRQKDFEFLGLYNLKERVQDNRHDVLQRDEEIKYMRQVLEEIIFPQNSVKQALCVTGPSGYGKSIILNFFKQAYKDEYRIFDFSGNYHEFEGHMLLLLGNNIDLKISEMTVAGKVVFIFDQFERFFFLSKKEQERIQIIIRLLCRKNTGVIVSLREEYLASFLKRFDMNNLLSVPLEQNVEPCGILRKLVSIIENKNNNFSVFSSFLEPIKTDIWEQHIIKRNASIYLDTQNEQVVFEKMGATLLYCLNQNEMNSQLDGKKSITFVLESKCKKIFGEIEGAALFRKHMNDPLIEQQIIFHMAEFNQKILSYSEEELHKFIEKDNNELMERYFDHQLASCNNYFHASRLLYLLSQARIRQLSIKTQDLENYLFPELFAEKGHEHLMEVIRELETVQLIRKNTEGSGLEYEIAHDFIATAYLNYCSTNMDRNVKGALDLFILEYMDAKRNTSFKEKISLRKNIYKQHFYRNVSYFALAFMAISHLVQRFIFNPWTTIWKDFNPYGDYMPTFPLFITILSGIYIFYMYDKTVKYYQGEKVRAVQILYILFAMLASMAVFAYPHFLLFDGVGLTVATLNIALLLDKRYRQTCRNELQAYGAKSCMIGTVFACAHILFFSVHCQFEDLLIISEFIMFTILVAYAFFVHMTQEFLYARMSDSSGEKV